MDGFDKLTAQVVVVNAWVNAYAQSPQLGAAPPKRRVIDLLNIDSVLHARGTLFIKNTCAFRDSYVGDDYLAGRDTIDGNVVRSSKVAETG